MTLASLHESIGAMSMWGRNDPVQMFDGQMASGQQAEVLVTFVIVPRFRRRQLRPSIWGV